MPDSAGFLSGELWVRSVTRAVAEVVDFMAAEVVVAAGVEVDVEAI